MYVSTGRRFLSYTVLGCLLLIIYQFVFMTRTSANRDWNHLHATHMSPIQVKRLVLQNVDESIAHLPSNGSAVLSEPFKPVSYKLPGSSITAVKYGDQRLNLSAYSNIFAYSSKTTTVLQLDSSDVQIVYHTGDTRLDEIIASTESKAVLLVVSSTWIPNHGLAEYDIPIIATLTAPFNNGDNGNVEIELQANEDGIAYEWQLDGSLADTVIVGDSRGLPANSAAFLGMAQAFQALVSGHGWKPLRTIKFVSFPQFSAAQWFSHHKSWISRRVVGYVDTNGPSTTSVSPLLNSTAYWAANQLIDANIMNRDEFDPQLISCLLGGNAVPFEFQIPSVSASFENPVTTARFLNLVLASLSQDPFLPFKLFDYAGVVANPLFYEEALNFDRRVEEFSFNFTQEFPWYQWGPKFQALAKRKRANLNMRLTESCFRDPKTHTHLLLGSDPSWTKTERLMVSDESFRDMMECLGKRLFDL